MRRLIDQPAPDPVNPIHDAHTCLALTTHLTILAEFWQMLARKDALSLDVMILLLPARGRR
jgi:hypothetical protein